MRRMIELNRLKTHIHTDTNTILHKAKIVRGQTPFHISS